MKRLSPTVFVLCAIIFLLSVAFLITLNAFIGKRSEIAQLQSQEQSPPTQKDTRRLGEDGREAADNWDSAAAQPPPAIPKPGGLTNIDTTVALTSKAYPETLPWNFLPRGACVLDGTTFLVNGAIRTGGLSAIGDNGGRRFPGMIQDVGVNRRGSRIHLLQGAEHGWAGMPIGAPYAHFVLHYADGKTHQFDLNFGVHGWDWASQVNKPDADVFDPNTRLVWSIQRPPRWPNGLKELRMFHTILQNPHPDVTITSFDVTSTLQTANLLLFGFTVDNDTRRLADPLQPSEMPPDDAGQQRIIFTLQDAAGKALPDAKLSWAAVINRGRIDFPPVSADALGQVKIDVPRGKRFQIVYRASGSDRKQAAGVLDGQGGFFPEAQVVELTSGQVSDSLR